MFMQKHANDFSIEKMAQILGISRSGYSVFVTRKPSNRKARIKHLLESIKKVYIESRRTYGSPRIYKMLKKQGIFCPKYIKKLCDAFLHSKTNDNKIWTLLMFQIWYERNYNESF